MVLGLVGIAVLTASGTLALSPSVLLGIAACLVAKRVAFGSQRLTGIIKR